MGIIRLLLALSVVADHSGPILGFRLAGGQIAVQSFYIISGFYMSLILNEKYVGRNNSYRLFITNRFIRLFPVYWTVLLGTILICLSIAIVTRGHSIPIFDSYLSVKTNISSFAYLVLTNLLLFGQDMIMFLGISPDSGSLFLTSNFNTTSPPLHSFMFIPQAWTLGLELAFYLIAPFIVRRGLKIVLPLILASLLLRFFIYNHLGLQHDPWTYRFFPTEIIFFLLGYLSYQIHVRLKKISLPRGLNLFTLLFILFFTILYPNIPSFKVSYLPFSLKECFYFSTITLAIPLLFNFLKKSKLDNQIGELSYPVYISHMSVILVCNELPLLTLRTGWVIALITIIISYLLNKLITSPIERYRQARLRK